ncbi:MAG: DUF4124 domain-containing protein [Halioglobus sp.]|nr:DUF4124 domain-containing protein [Halioglobus sp.]
MSRVVIALLIAALPQVASAGVYMCTDRTTGKTTFTDSGCETTASREEVRVDRTNLDSGKRYGKVAARKVWNSQRESRKSGREYNAQPREIYENRATVAVTQEDVPGS